MTLKPNEMLELIEALAAKPLNEGRAEALAAAALPLMRMLESLNTLELEAIEPPLMPLWPASYSV